MTVSGGDIEGDSLSSALDVREAEEEPSSAIKGSRRNTGGGYSTRDLSFCVVWSPLPPLTWIFPFIGHMGIANSTGIASDFRGPYFVGDDGRMLFGAPTRALTFKVDAATAEIWDAAIREANEEYRKRNHNICCDNCHSHVAFALNAMEGKVWYGTKHWDMVKLTFMMFFCGRFLSVSAVWKQFGPFALLLLLLLLAYIATN